MAVFKVFRGDASGGKEMDYEVPSVPGQVVLDALHYIQANQAPDLAVRWNCKAAKCGSCSAEINGKPGLMCKTRVDAFGDEDIHVHPMKTFPLMKDLVTDVSWNYKVNKKIQPFTYAEDEPTPFVIQQEDIDRVIEFRKCIECFMCQDVCHVLREHDEGKDEYFGPRFMIRIAGLEMHPKDIADRIPQVKGEAGIGYCNITKCCTEVCPEHIHITDNGIIPLKERIADRYFDPIRAVFRKLGAKRERVPAKE
ncbi:MAG: succinate dehydrogenase / fumarate reductase, iron-sulfur subunit [Chloroflexota bacterium]|jgi:succinate dehydrogenase / fumarate reductase iron-sulfur subunit|nr:succinate dehydrogenase / fumarate reductase, iron-sulfur subunit [Chloroflexota bacterium]